MFTFVTPTSSGEQVGEFGDKFRKARESKELSLDDVSNVTKISARMLQAIEAEHFDQLPGGVFNKGFIRAYAKHLGLNSDDAVTDYLACLRQAQIDAHEVWGPERAAPVRPPHVPRITPSPTVIVTPNKPAVKPAAPVEELADLHLPRAEHVRPKRKDFADGLPASIPWKSIVAVACVLIATFFLWTRHSRGTHAATAKSTPVATTASSSPVSASPRPSSSSQVPQPLAVASTAARPSTSEPAAQIQKPSATTRPTAEAPSPATPADNVQEKVIEKNDVTMRSFGPQVTKPTITPIVSLSLVIRATETSWISVTSDGQLVTQETLIAPANTTVHATREIVTRIGNAAGVTFLFNGQQIPAQGAEAEAKTFVFDAHGMRELPSQTSPQN